MMSISKECQSKNKECVVTARTGRKNHQGVWYMGFSYTMKLYLQVGARDGKAVQKMNNQMNNQEAIRILTNIRDEANESENGLCYVANDKDIIAMDRAIEALVLYDKHSKAVERMIEGAKEIKIFLERMTSDYKGGDKE